MDVTPPSPDRPSPGVAARQDSDGLFPWRFFVRALACTVRGRVLLLAAIGVAGGTLIDPAGWAGQDADLDFPRGFLTAASGPCLYWRGLVDAVARPFFATPAVGWRGWGTAAGAVVWWALVGGAIARVAATQVTLRPAPSLFAAMSNSARQLPARCLPLLGVTLAAAGLLLPLWLHGWLMELPVLDVLSALLLPIPLALAALSAVILVLLALNWPLLMVCPAVERTDPFDATSRAFAYVTQRPVQLAAYLLTALLVAAPVGLLLFAATRLLLWFATACLPELPDDPGLADQLAAFWLRAFATQLPVVFYAAYTWCGSVAVYLLLRRDIDGVQVDELEAAPRG